MADADAWDPHGDALERARAERRAERARRRAGRADRKGRRAPAAPRTEPDGPHPEPDTTRPELHTARPEPDTAHPEPDTAHPEPHTAHPEPDTAHPEPDRLQPQPRLPPQPQRPRLKLPTPRAPRTGLLATSAGRALAAAAGALALLTVVGLVALWPGHLPGGEQQAFGGPTVGARVTATRTVRCPGPTTQRCRQLTARLGNGDRVSVDLGPVTATPSLATGARIRVQRSGNGYGYVDVDRHLPMLWLAIALAILAVLVARWRGLLALVGVAISVVLVITFLVPAILAGSDPLLTSLVAALAVMFVTLLLTYGPGAQSLAASLGIGLSLLVAAVVGHAAVTALREANPSLGPRDLYRGAFAVGRDHLSATIHTLVLAYVGAALPLILVLRDSHVGFGLGPRALYRGAFAVGRDHLSATIHTLVLAYVGAALPLILILRNSHVGFTDAMNVQIVAEPVVATLVGAIALVAAVPLTTALAAILVARVPATALDAHHGHAH